MDLFDVAIAKKMSGGGGGNPNRVETITGTANDLGLSLNKQMTLRDAIGQGEASATITLVSEQLGIYMRCPLTTIGGNLSGSVANFADNSLATAYSASWTYEDGLVKKLVVYANGTVTDGTAYASMITSTLNITWHPLP